MRIGSFLYFEAYRKQKWQATIYLTKRDIFHQSRRQHTQNVPFWLLLPGNLLG
jgi:hypothetical protein